MNRRESKPKDCAALEFLNTHSAAVQAIATVILVFITGYYAVVTSQISRATDANVAASKRMAETAEQNVSVSKQMLDAANETIKEAREARREQMRPFFSFKTESRHREGIGTKYILKLINQGQTPATSVKLSVNNELIGQNLAKELAFLGSNQNVVVLALDHQAMVQEKIPMSFLIAIHYQDVNGFQYDQKIDVALGDTDNDTLAYTNERLFTLNNEVQRIRELYEIDQRNRSRGNQNK